MYIINHQYFVSQAWKNLQNMIEDDSMQCNMDRIRYLSCSESDEGGYNSKVDTLLEYLIR